MKLEEFSEKAAKGINPGKSDLEVASSLGHVYKAARNVRLRAEGILLSMTGYRRGHGLHILDRGTTIASRQMSLQKYMASQGFSGVIVQSMIGEAGNFPCPDCRSVSSPSAYLCEALNFLPDDARSHLLERRPDIAQLPLSCENTEVALPYLDTANEVMESFIHHLHDITPILEPINIDAFNTPTDAESEDMLIQDTNMDTFVYINYLQKAVFPLKLPYNLGLNKTRLILKLMKATRSELMLTFQDESRMRHFRGSSNLDPATLQQLKADQQLVITNAVAAEELGLSYADFVAITKQAYWPISAFNKKLPKPQGWTPDDYHQQIRVMNVDEIWGFDPTDATPSPFQKAIVASDSLTSFLLPRSGMTFKDYTALTKAKVFSDLNLKAQIDVSPKVSEEACDRRQAFLRLQGRLGWSIEDVDNAIALWQETEPTQSWREPEFLVSLAYIKDVLDMSDVVDITSLLSLWSPISMNGDRSLLKRLFFRRSIKRLDPTFSIVAFDTTVTDPFNLRAPHLQTLLAATGCTKDGFTAITQSMSSAVTSPDDWQQLSLANMSMSTGRLSLQRSLVSLKHHWALFSVVSQTFFKNPNARIRYVSCCSICVLIY